MPYILVGVIFGVVAGVIANNKGRNVFGWFVAGLLIGPFGLAVLALPAKAQGDRFAECPACLETVRVEATICRHCGSALAA